MVGKIWYGPMNHRSHLFLQTAEFIYGEPQKSLLCGLPAPYSQASGSSFMIWAAIPRYSAGLRNHITGRITVNEYLDTLNY